MTQKTLAKHLDEYTALAQQIAALEAQKQAVADKIKDAMGEAEEVQAGAYTARYKAVTSSRFDAKAFQQAHRKLYSAFCRPQILRVRRPFHQAVAFRERQRVVALHHPGNPPLPISYGKSAPLSTETRQRIGEKSGVNP